MAFVNIPANFQDMFNLINNRLQKLETGPNQAMYYAETVQGTASSAQALAESAMVDAAAAQAAAAIAYDKAAQSIQVSAQTIVNASNQLEKIDANGITVYSGASSTSGARVLMNSLGIVAYNSSGTNTMTISGADGSISMLGSLTAGSTISGSTITGGVIQTSSGNDAVVLNGDQNALGIKYGGVYAGWLLGIGSGAFMMHYGTTPSITGYPRVSVSSTTTSLAANGSSSLSINTTGNNNMVGNMQFFNNVYIPTSITTPSTANGYVNASTGLLARSTASSRRYKHDIVNLKDVPELNPNLLYDLPVRAFRFNDGYITATDDRVGALVPGFIAEEVDAIYPVLADYVGGEVETWNDRMLVPALLQLVQDLNDRVKLLESN